MKNADLKLITLLTTDNSGLSKGIEDGSFSALEKAGNGNYYMINGQKF